MIVRTLIALALLAGAAPALAWGDYAHRLIAGMAMADLSPRARAQVRQILARGASVDTPACPLRTIEDASVWPDCVRGLGDRFARQAPWHYQNIDVCQPFDIRAKCADGNCVTAQIPRQLAIAADRRASPAARAEALALVVHLVADMHQPLHIGDKHDRGGNDVRATYGAKAPERMNLHRVWDSDLAERALTERPALTPRHPQAGRTRIVAAGTIVDWARESWNISRRTVYPELKGYPDTCPARSVARAGIDPRYIRVAIPVVRLQVERAGSRLALLLNAALGQ